MLSKLRKYVSACDSARAAAGYDDVVTPVRSLPLVSLGWEDERRDLHGISVHGWSRHDATTTSVVLSCYCGHDLAVSADHPATGTANHNAWNAAEDAAFDLLVEHAHTASLAASS